MDNKVILKNREKFWYDSMTESRKTYVRKLIVSTPGTCSGEPRVINTRLRIDWVIDAYIQGELNDYTIDLPQIDIIDAMIVWVCENI